jgi:hypothetical protein
MGFVQLMRQARKEAQAAPLLGGADPGAKHELEHRVLAEAVGDDLQAQALLAKQPRAGSSFESRADG